MLRQTMGTDNGKVAGIRYQFGEEERFVRYLKKDHILIFAALL